MNPYHRDVLYNLSRLYLLDSAFMQRRFRWRAQLVTVDPSNPDNYQLIAIAYASMKKSYDVKLKDAEAKAKVYGQRANTSKAACRHEGEHRLGRQDQSGHQGVRGFGAVDDRLGAEVSGDHDQAARQGRVHRVHAER